MERLPGPLNNRITQRHAGYSIPLPKSQRELFLRPLRHGVGVVRADVVLSRPVRLERVAAGWTGNVPAAIAQLLIGSLPGELRTIADTDVSTFAVHRL